MEAGMGQAKIRGTFEQRSAQAQQRAAEEHAKRERKEAEVKDAERQRVAAMPPEERKRYSERKHRSYLKTAMLMGTLIGALQDIDKPSRHGKA
jgi:hypothetical protein